MNYLSSAKKPGLLRSILIFGMLGLFISRCSKPSDANIDAVYFAQKHVLEAENELFKLFSNLEALIKVHVVSPTNSDAPAIEAILSLNGETLTLPLTGPDQLLIIHTRIHITRFGKGEFLHHMTVGSFFIHIHFKCINATPVGCAIQVIKYFDTYSQISGSMYLRSPWNGIEPIVFHDLG